MARNRLQEHRAQGAHTSGESGCLFEIYVWENIEESYIVNLCTSQIEA